MQAHININIHLWYIYLQTPHLIYIGLYSSGYVYTCMAIENADCSRLERKHAPNPRQTYKHTNSLTSAHTVCVLSHRGEYRTVQRARHVSTLRMCVTCLIINYPMCLCITLKKRIRPPHVWCRRQGRCSFYIIASSSAQLRALGYSLSARVFY